jgi:ABC-2 type transport system permease protein
MNNQNSGVSGVVFLETLRRTWKGTLGWAFGMALMVGYVVVAIPDVKTLQQYTELFKNSPKIAVLLLGSDTAAMMTAEGMFGVMFFSWIMLVLSCYGVIAGLSITANEEERGIMDVLLAMPLPRWRIVIEKFAAHVLNTFVIAFLTFLAIWAFTTNSELYKITAGSAFASSMNMIPPILVTIAFTAFVASVVRRRGQVIAIAGAFVAVSYLLDLIGRATEGTSASLRYLSFFTWFDGTNVLIRGAQVGSMLLLTVVALVLIAAATGLFQRRDVGV